MHLVFHAGPLAEFMLLMPMFRALPKPVTIVAPWQRASLAQRLIGSSAMDIELFEFTRLHAENGPSRVSPAVQELFDSASTITSFLSGEEDAWSTNVARLSPNARLLLVDPRPAVAYQGHFADWHRQQLAERGLVLKPVEPQVLDQPEGPIVIHPGSSAIKRSWPVEHYRDLTEQLKAKGLPVTPVIGEVEAERWTTERIEQWTEQLGAVVLRTADALLPLLQQARLFIGNDAGPMHIAAQAGTPTIAVLGPTDPAKAGPKGAHVRFVTPPDGPGRVDDVSLQSVLDTALE